MLRFRAHDGSDAAPMGSAAAGRGSAGGHRGPVRRFVSSVLAVALFATFFSTIAATVLTTALPQRAGAANSQVAASWNTTPACNAYSTANPPLGAFSASVVLSGGGGGGGAGKGGGSARFTPRI